MGSSLTSGPEARRKVGGGLKGIRAWLGGRETWNRVSALLLQAGHTGLFPGLQVPHS